MCRVLDTSGLRLDRKTYYNFMRNKPLEDRVLNNSFKDLILALKEVRFRFTYLISNELVDNGSIKGRVLK
jgi:hypothetical protein